MTSTDGGGGIVDQSQPPRTGGENQGMATEVVQTAKEHTRELGDEVARQAQNVTGQVKERLSGEVQNQNERLATTLRHLSEELETMHKNAPADSMAAAMVQRLGEGSRQAADYLRAHGPEGVLQEVQEFARRKPGTFLLTSAVAGFVVARLGKGLLTGGGNGSGNGSSDGSARTYTGSTYPAGTTRTDISGTTDTTVVTEPAAHSRPAVPALPPDPAMAQRSDVVRTDRDRP
jgi:hypothetical protein